MKVTVLGSAQDGGFPEWDCNCLNCRLSRQNALKFRFRSSLAVESENGCIVVLDASPDLKSQISMLRPYSRRISEAYAGRVAPIDAILITHAHWGHIMGLLELSAGYPFKIPVYCSHYVASIIRSSRIFKSLVDGNFIDIIEFGDGDVLDVVDWRGRRTGLKFEAFKVPHREDFTDTYGFKVFDKKSSIVYIPDIKTLSNNILSRIEGSNALFFEGTFYWEDELWRISGIRRTSTELGHIPMVESLSILKELQVNLKYYIHLNHTNPTLRSNSDERRTIEKAGLKIAFDGLAIEFR